MEMKLRHNLSMDAALDILKWTNMVCGQKEEKVVTLKYLFEKASSATSAGYTFHCVCHICNSHIGPLTNILCLLYLCAGGVGCLRVERADRLHIDRVDRVYMPMHNLWLRH